MQSDVAQRMDGQIGKLDVVFGLGFPPRHIDGYSLLQSRLKIVVQT